LVTRQFIHVHHQMRCIGRVPHIGIIEARDREAPGNRDMFKKEAGPAIVYRVGYPSIASGQAQKGWMNFPDEPGNQIIDVRGISAEEKYAGAIVAHAQAVDVIGVNPRRVQIGSAVYQLAAIAKDIQSFICVDVQLDREGQDVIGATRHDLFNMAASGFIAGRPALQIGLINEFDHNLPVFDRCGVIGGQARKGSQAEQCHGQNEATRHIYLFKVFM
jgi:hypothetical protein